MKTRTILLTLATLLAAVVVCFAAEDVNMGTWKLNETKSKISPGTPKNTTVVYAAAGDSVKVTVDGVAADGKSRTVTLSGADANGKKITSTSVYDKQ